MKTVALDSSSAIYLAKIGLLPLLIEMQIQLVVTNEISEEIRKGAEKGYKDALLIDALIKEDSIKVANTKMKERIKKNHKLKDADASVMALALERDCLLATEDATLQNVAKALGARITNAATLLYYAHLNQKMQKKQCLMLLDLLQHHGYNKEIIMTIKGKIVEEGEKDE